MEKYLVMEAMKFLNGTYATRVVAEFDASEQAHERALYLNRTNKSDFFRYKVIKFTYPKF